MMIVARKKSESAFNYSRTLTIVKGGGSSNAEVSETQVLGSVG